MNSLTFRPTQILDVPAIRAMCVDVGVFSQDEVEVVDELLDAYFERGPEASGYRFISAVDEGVTVAFACYGPRAITHGTYDLYWIVTAPEAGRNGIGGQLLDAVEQAVSDLKGRMIIAETSGRADYINTRNFYVKYNYVAEAQIRDFYSVGDDLVIFVRRLTPQSTLLPPRPVAT